MSNLPHGLLLESIARFWAMKSSTAVGFSIFIGFLSCLTAFSDTPPRIGFSPPTNVPVNSPAESLKIADFDKDGNLDILVGDLGITLLFGDGSGSFGRRTNLSSSPLDALVLVQDFNNDGYLDIALAEYYALRILLGRPGGTFWFPPTTSYHSASKWQPAQILLRTASRMLSALMIMGGEWF